MDIHILLPYIQTNDVYRSSITLTTHFFILIFTSLFNIRMSLMLLRRSKGPEFSGQFLLCPSFFKVNLPENQHDNQQSHLLIGDTSANAYLFCCHVS